MNAVLKPPPAIRIFRPRDCAAAVPASRLLPAVDNRPPAPSADDLRKSRRFIRLAPRVRPGAEDPYCCPELVAAGSTWKVKAVNIISSHVWSPHHTSLVGSGFDLFAFELSYQADAWIFVPAGSLNGCANWYSCCHAKS